MIQIERVLTMIKQKKWYSVFVYGKLIAVKIDSRRFQKEVNRLRCLKGIRVVLSSYTELIKFNASTPLPAAYITKFDQARIKLAHPLSMPDPFDNQFNILQVR